MRQQIAACTQTFNFPRVPNLNPTLRLRCQNTTQILTLRPRQRSDRNNFKWKTGMEGLEGARRVGRAFTEVFRRALEKENWKTGTSKNLSQSPCSQLLHFWVERSKFSCFFFFFFSLHVKVKIVFESLVSHLFVQHNDYFSALIFHLWEVLVKYPRNILLSSLFVVFSINNRSLRFLALFLSLSDFWENIIRKHSAMMKTCWRYKS